MQHGYEFIDEFFIQHHFKRYTSNKYLHPQPFHFFFWVLPLMTIPWLPFFAMRMIAISKRAIETLRRAVPLPSSNDHSLTFFALAWLAVPVLFFSFSGSKLPGYILPALPAAMILAGIEAARFARRSSAKGKLIFAVAGGVYIVVVVGLFTFVPRLAETDTVKHLIEAADRRGFESAPVASLHTISHNAEFYAAGRIIRGADGKQRKFFGPSEIREYMRKNGLSRAVVLVPLEYKHDLVRENHPATEYLIDNGELAVALIREE
jgi:hypothetical protein